MSFLLDTDTCSAYLRQHPAVSSKVLLHFGSLHVSVITACELLAWGFRAKAARSRLGAIRDLLAATSTHDINLDVAETFAKLRAEQLDRGRVVGPFDLLNAAVALTNEFTLVTHNTKDYIEIDRLRLEDWVTT